MLNAVKESGKSPAEFLALLKEKETAWRAVQMSRRAHGVQALSIEQKIRLIIKPDFF